jgi:IS5 family transposase
MHFLIEITPRLLTMQPKKSDRQRSFLCPDLLVQLDPRNHLLGLAKAIPWNVFKRTEPHL